MLNLRLAALLAASILGVSAGTFAADALVKPNDMLAITGDSITEQRMYSVFMEDYILMCKPVAPVRSMQMGWSGDTTWGFFKDKIDNDVLRFHPTVLTTCFGMNDGGYSKLTDATAERYRSTTQKMIDKFKAAGVRSIIIGSPGSVGIELKGKAADANEYNKTLAALREIDKQLAEKNGVTFADVYTPMIEVNEKARAKYGQKYQVNGPDGVHPRENGHLIMAYAFLKAMGFSGDIGTITVDMTGGKATASDGHKPGAVKVDNGSLTAEFESTRYPFCFTGDPALPNATSGVIEFFPFNQELNRFLLVVKNAPAEKMKVTWGSGSKEFTSAELAKGINLAAEFLDNPFSEQFEKVHEAVKAQQGFETPFVKNFIYNIPACKQGLPEKDRPMLDALGDSGAANDKALFDSATAMVAPVRHTIKIETAK